MARAAQLQPEGVEGTYAATYTSSDEDVAVVDLEGNVTATGVGSATITLHVEGNGGQKDFTCAVTCQWEDNLPRLEPDRLHAEECGGLLPPPDSEPAGGGRDGHLVHQR